MRYQKERAVLPVRGHGQRVFKALVVVGLLTSPVLFANSGFSGPAIAQTAEPDAAAGQQLATQWCTQCHGVEKSGDQVTKNTDVQRRQPAIPTLSEISNRKALTAEALTGRLIFPHPVMPNLNLSRKEAADLAAYILSL